MPFINIRTAPNDITEDQANQLIKRTTDLMHDVMGKKRERTTVHIQPEDGHLWAVGGETMSAVKGRAVLMDIKVTAGTNTTAEKEGMVQESYKMLLEVLEAMPQATYVVIDEIPGESWGKAGVMMYERAAADRIENLKQKFATKVKAIEY